TPGRGEGGGSAADSGSSAATDSTRLALAPGCTSARRSARCPLTPLPTFGFAVAKALEVALLDHPDPTRARMFQDDDELVGPWPRHFGGAVYSATVTPKPLASRESKLRIRLRHQFGGELPRMNDT